MKRSLYFSFLCVSLFLSSCGIEDTPEPQQIVGEWRFDQVKAGKTLDFCPDDITPEFQNKIIEFTPDVVHIKDAQTKQIIVSGTWESQNVPVYMGEDVSYVYELTTHFPAMINDHDFSWNKVRYSSGKRWLSLRNCERGDCFKYELKSVE